MFAATEAQDEAQRYPCLQHLLDTGSRRSRKRHADPGRLIGVHFFNPVPQMPLVEVVRGPGSRESEVRQGCAFVAAIGKFPLITKSTPGFLVNRVLAPYMFGAAAKIEEGIPKEKIDAAAEKFGMPMGPIELVDTVGLDIGNMSRTISAFRAA